MMASRATPPAMEGEGAEENGTVEAVGSIVSTHGCFGLSCASLYQIKLEHMDRHDSRREDELIMSSGFLIHIYDRCDEVRGKSMEKSSIKER